MKHAATFYLPGNAVSRNLVAQDYIESVRVIHPFTPEVNPHSNYHANLSTRIVMVELRSMFNDRFYMYVYMSSTGSVLSVW